MSADCWLFLDCIEMTGKPPGECPNRKNCKHNALHSPNRMCEIQYTYQIFEPEKDQLFEHKEAHLRVHQNCPEEAIEAGWYSAQELFYEYHKGSNCLLIGKPTSQWNLRIPEEAKALGFATAESLPYVTGVNARKGRLSVVRYSPMSGYPPAFKEAGWYPAVDLPYCIIPADGISRMIVSFWIGNPDYQEAIKAGWHPAQPIG